jgi:hypothetical protein
MKAGLAQKKSAKEAWDVVEKSCASDDHMKDASIQRLMKQFEVVAFCDGESVADFAMHINGFLTSLRELGEELTAASSRRCCAWCPRSCTKSQ